MRVLVVTGAGVSAESGIPTFRGRDGYWRNLDPAKLATPEAFARDPELVWQWYRERRERIRAAQPNAAHHAIAKLPPSQSYGAAGEQGQRQEQEQENVLPRCPKCDALMRPGVVWFGEQLPWSEAQRVKNFLSCGGCDVVIVAGTTATFGYIIDWALRASRRGGELIEVNPEETPLSRFATRLVPDPAAIALPRLVDQMIK